MTLEDKMKSFDWWFEYSDDHGVWLKGVDGLVEIERELRKIPYEDAEKLWNMYGSKRYGPYNKDLHSKGGVR